MFDLKPYVNDSVEFVLQLHHRDKTQLLKNLFLIF